MVVGPEGGLSPAEVEHFQAQGALPVWLGPFVLRAETASLYAVAAVNTILQETPEWTIPM
jgi:16S rRNA (uracil1498-N3)-methyltransferase